MATKVVATRAPAAPIAGGPLYISIVPDSDFVIQLKPIIAKQPLADNATNVANRARVVCFRVKRAVLLEHSGILVGLLEHKPNVPRITFDNEGPGFGYALEIWLRVIHTGAESLPSNLKATHMERAWVAMCVGEHFGFAPAHIQKLRPWFLDCYQFAMDNGGMTPFAACCLAFPCSWFNHPGGLKAVTKFLAYNTNGTVFSNNPSSFHRLDHDSRILDGPLNAARAHIQSTLDKELNFILDKLHRATCSCRKETAFDYQETLMELECWPLDHAVQKYPIAEILTKLHQFQFTPKTTGCESGVCNMNFRRSVSTAINRANDAFDGLCLNCMDRSQAGWLEEKGLKNYLYEAAPDARDGRWDAECEYTHGRATWYFSWMGPSSIRRDVLAKWREDKRAIEANRGRRGGRGGRAPRAPRGPAPGKAAELSSIEDKSAKSQTSENATTKDENNKDTDYADYDDDDVFFDAKDTSLDDRTVTDNADADFLELDGAGAH